MDKNSILIPILPNTPLPNLKINKNKNRKNVVIGSYPSSKNNFSDKNLLQAANISNEIFSDNKNEQEFIPTSEKTKWV